MPPNKSSQDGYFPSKRDGWMVGLIWFGVVVSVMGGILPLVVGGAPWTELVLMASLVVGLDVLMFWVLYGTGYTVVPEHLSIQCGPFAFQVSLDTIESITPTRSPWSSPACSLDRLKIVYGLSRQRIMVSPADKPGFLSAIVQHCPSLIVLHDRARRKTNASTAAVDRSIQPKGIVSPHSQF